MKITIANGVDLQVVKTAKFETTTILVNLISPWQADQSAARGLLSRMMANANQIYPDQQAIANHLAWMNGANFDSDVTRYGNQHVLRLELTIPHNAILDNKALLNLAIDFLHTVLFKPLVKNNQFDADLLKVQKTNMKRYLASIRDDKSYYSFRKMMELYYQDQPPLAQGEVGTIEDVDRVDARSVYQVYQDLLQNARIQITVLGNVDAQQVERKFEQWPLANRPLMPLKIKVATERPILNVDSEQQAIQQTKLNLGYILPVYYYDDLFFAALLFNQLLGGSTQSRLFQVVRERYHLAYYADSSYNALFGTLFLQAGVNQQQLSQAQQLIQKQIQDLQKGQFSEAELTQLKIELLNAKLANLDAPQQMTLTLFNRWLLNPNESLSDWQHRLMKVTKEQVIQVAQALQLKAQFTLLGGN